MTEIKPLNKIIQKAENIYNLSSQEKKDKMTIAIFKRLPLHILKSRLKAMPTKWVMDEHHQHIYDIAQKVYDERIKKARTS